MLGAVGLSGIEAQGRMRQSGTYTLLFTRRWMLVVPRSREHFGPVSVNALGFAGSMFVRDDEQMQAVRQAGPMKVLAGVVPGPNKGCSRIARKSARPCEKTVDFRCAE